MNTSHESELHDGMPQSRRRHRVILVHGIRTHAQWFMRARTVFKEDLGYLVHPIKYGRFDLFRFMLPGPWRRGPIDKARRKISPILEEAKQNGEPVTVIAHSNGTYVVTQLLSENTAFRITNLLLCGSVVDDDYRWDSVRPQITGKIINDYGAKDVWPAVASSLSWGYGNTGTNGIGDPVIDRLHDTGHSDYFTDMFMRDYWLSFVETGIVREPEREPEGVLPSPPRWFVLFELPLRWGLVAAFVLGLFVLFLAVADSTPIIPTVPTATSADGKKGPNPSTATPENSHKTAPAAQIASNFRIVRATAWNSEQWKTFTIYQGKPRNSFETSDIEEPRFDSGEEETPDYESVKVAAVLHTYGLDRQKTDLTRLRSCLASMAVLARCPTKFQAAALELSGITNEYMVDSIASMTGASARESLDQYLSKPSKPPALREKRMQFIIRNDTNSSQIIYGIRLRERASYGAQGSGEASNFAMPIAPIKTGTIKLVDALTMDCAIPKAPVAILEFESPISVPPNGTANVEFILDTRLYYVIGGSRVGIWSTESFKNLGALTTECKSYLQERREALKIVPKAFEAAIAAMNAPLLHDYQNSAMAFAVKDDSGEWRELGTFNIFLP